METALLAAALVLQFIGAIFQSLTGYGANILTLMFLPVFLPLLEVSAATSVASIFVTVANAVTFRQYIVWKHFFRAMPVFLATSFIAIYTGPVISPRILGILFGIFLLLLAIWSAALGKRHRTLSVKPIVTIPVLIFSGIASGWFGLSGPLIALYFLAVTNEDKYIYIATIQAFFVVTSITNTIARIANGILTAELIPLCIVCTIGVMAGRSIGIPLLKKVNIHLIERLIIIGLAFSGIMSIVKNIL